MEKGKTVTLRIKKVFFDAIKEGRKKKEYRDFKPFYEKLFKENVGALKLHYQGNEMLTVEVKKIQVINTPKWLHGVALISGFKFTDRVFQISLGKILT